MEDKISLELIQVRVVVECSMLYILCRNEVVEPN